MDKSKLKNLKTLLDEYKEEDRTEYPLNVEIISNELAGRLNYFPGGFKEGDTVVVTFGGGKAVAVVDPSASSYDRTLFVPIRIVHRIVESNRGTNIPSDGGFYPESLELIHKAGDEVPFT